VSLMIQNNQITLLQNGAAYFPAIEAAIDRAKHEIYLESYIFKNDNTGRSISDALRRASLRGVKTHLLIDGFGSSSMPKSLIDYLKSAGVMVMKFRPRISPWTLRRHRLRRLHRKILVVDQDVAFVGGINIQDDMDTATDQMTRYDCAVSVAGPLVGMIRHSSHRLWSRLSWIRLRPYRDREGTRQIPLTEPTGHMRSAFLIRDNIRHRRTIENAYLEAIEQARFEIIIANAYFLPGLNFRHALLDAAGRGVRVILLLQGVVEYRLLHYAELSLRDSFLDAGIEIYEYHKGILHAKVAVIDDHWSTVGSSNLDPFSLLLALEANVVVDDENFAKTLKHSLEQAIHTGAMRILQSNWRKQPILLRLVSWLSYGLVRFLTGIAGYAPGKHSGHE